MSDTPHIAIHFTPAANGEMVEKATDLLGVDKKNTDLQLHPKGNTLWVEGISSAEAGPELEKGWPGKVVFAPSVATIFLNFQERNSSADSLQETEAEDLSRDCTL